MSIHGAYRMQLSARYRLRLPAEWRSAFVDRGILCWAENHWKLYPAAEFYKWMGIISAMYEKTPLPSGAACRIAAALPVIISPKTGTLKIPAALRLLPPGPVEVMALDYFIEIWPVEAWRKERTAQMERGGISKAEILALLAPLKLTYIDLPPPPRDC